MLFQISNKSRTFWRDIINGGIFKKVRDKKITILISILILLLIIAGVFFWQRGKTFRPENVWEIKDTLEGEIAENKKDGLIVKVPDGWMVKKDETGIGFFSPEIEFNEYGGFLDSVRDKGACVLGIETREGRETEIEYLNNLIIGLQEGVEELEQDGYSLVSINNQPAVKRIYKKDGEIRFIDVELPLKNKVYYFESGLIINQKCVQEFNKILETALINI